MCGSWTFHSSSITNEERKQKQPDHAWMGISVPTSSPPCRFFFDKCHKMVFSIMYTYYLTTTTAFYERFRIVQFCLTPLWNQ